MSTFEAKLGTSVPSARENAVTKKYKDLVLTHENLSNEFKSLRDHYETTYAQLKSLKNKYVGLVVYKDTLHSLMEGLERDPSTGFWVLGEESCDCVDEARKLCGKK